MNKKILTLCLLVLGFSASVHAQNLFGLQRNELTTVEKGRRHYSVAKCCAGEIRKQPYVEITYVTTDKCGKSVEWTKVYKTGGITDKHGVEIDLEEEFDKGVNDSLNKIFRSGIARKIIGL